MRVFIAGGGGFLGDRLARVLARRGTIPTPSGEARIVGITCLDTAFPRGAIDGVECVSGDVGAPGVVAAALPRDVGVVFHLAAVVSAGAEADFDLGMRVNFSGTQHVLEACRASGACPRVLFTSSVAAFGGELPAVVDDTTTPNPQSSYGAQKVIGEYLVADYSRKGFIDGRSLRLPTIVVRPGRPNLAASSFASGILREPIAGEEAICPVPETTGVWMLSPDRVIDGFLHACSIDSATWGVNRTLNLPGITVSVREMIDALGRVAGQAVAKRVRFVPDARIEAIVQTWPARFRTVRADALGFKADAGIEAIIRQHMGG